MSGTDIFTEFVITHKLIDDAYWTARHYFWFSLIRRQASLWQNAALKHIFSTWSRFFSRDNSSANGFLLLYKYVFKFFIFFLFSEIGRDDRSRWTSRVSDLGVFWDDFSYSTYLPKLLFEFLSTSVNEFIVSIYTTCLSNTTRKWSKYFRRLPTAANRKNSISRGRVDGEKRKRNRNSDPGTKNFNKLKRQ